MATKKEIEINLKSSFDAKGVEEARKQIESLKNVGKSSSRSSSEENATADDQSKTAEKEAQAEERRKKKAQEAADAIEQARRREKAALEELVSELEQYQAVLQKATQEENHPDRLKALKNIQELERRIAALTKAQERQAQAAEKVAQSSNQLDRNSQQATRSVKNMGQGMLQVAYFMDDVQYGIKGILNNIPGLVMGFGGGAGLAGAMSLAVLAGAKLYDWMGKMEDKSADLAKKMKEHSKEIAEASRQAIRASYQALQEFNQQERTKTVNEEYQNYVKGITREFEYQTEELEKQIRLRREEAARQKGIDTRQAELDRVNLEVGYQEGRITKRQRDYGLMMVDQNLDQKIRQRDLGVEQANYMDIGKQLAEAVKARDAAEAHAFDMQFKQGNLPSLQNVLGLLQQQERSQRSIDSLESQLPDLRGEIWEKNKEYNKVLKRNGGYETTYSSLVKKEIDDLVAKQDRLVELIKTAREEANQANDQLKSFQDVLGEGGVNLELDYSQGTDVNSRFKQVSDAVEEFKKNTDAAKKQFDKLTEKAGSLGDAMASTEASIKNMEQIDAIQNQIDAGKVKSFNMQRDREEAEEARRNEEKIKKARERAEREAQKQTAERQQAMIRGITLEGVPEHPTAQQRARIAAAREALNAGKKRLAESISDKDTEIDPSEIQGAFDVMENVLRESGQYTKKLMDYLKIIAIAQASKVNAVQADTKKYVDAKFEEILKIVQKGNGRLQTGINRLAGGF